MTVAVAALAAVVAHLAEPPSAVGAAPSALEVSLDVERCSFLPRDQVFKLVALELEAPVVTPDRAGEQTARVEVACAGAEVNLAVSDRLTGKVLTRTMTLAGRDTQVDARMIAIAVAELVLTSWMELTLPRASAATASHASRADGPPAAPELRRAAQQRAQRHFPRSGGTGYVLAVGQAVGPFEGVGVAWGGGLRFGWTPGGARVEEDVAIWRPGFDLELTTARNEAGRALGTIDVSMWSAALRVSVRLARGRSWFDAGAGARAGVARLAGMPDDVTTTRGATLAGTWAGPIAYVGVGRRFWRLAAAAGLEGGTVLRPVSGQVDDGPSIAVAGRWLSGTLAIGWGG
jgi:hypothetical protein